MKKVIAIVFAIGLLIIVTLLFWHHTNHPGDAAIRHKLVGTWISSNQAIKGGVAFSSDGNFVVNEVFGIGTNERPVVYEGTWQLKDGFLITTTRKSDTKSAHVEAVTRVRIIRVNDQELIYRDEHAGVVTRKRGQ